MRKLNLVGQIFGKLKVLAAAPCRKGVSYFLCHCTCGNKKEIHGPDLKRGNYQSCGCQQGNPRQQNKQHPLYEVWKGMKARCRDIKHIAYKNYGGRGITVCDEWKDDYNAFFMWSIMHGYRPGLQCDRINPDGNYDPLNCRWVTAKENSRRSRRVKLDMQKAAEIRATTGVPTRFLAAKYGVCKATIQQIRNNKIWV